MRIVVGGGCDYYPGSATSSPSFTFSVAELRIAGEGDLLVALERLRRRLAADGLFEPQKRLPRPLLPRTIGVVTGEQGKARDDVLAGLAPARLGGSAGVGVRARAGPSCGAARSPPRCASSRRSQEVEVVIVARGGGSLADLFAFCDEALCRTVALLRVPVISSVGHHTDRTLIDDVAAVCCSTPTHAAEAAVPIDCRAARADAGDPRAPALHGHGRRAIVDRARALGAPRPARPRQHVTRHRRQLHQLLRELRASARRAVRSGPLAGRRAPAGARPHRGPRRRAQTRPGAGASSSAWHSRSPPTTPSARSLAATRWSQDRAGEPLGIGRRGPRRRASCELRFHDGVVGARVDEEERE